MTDVVITPASVVAGGNSTQADGVAAVSISTGDVIYKSTTDSKWHLADNNGATAAEKVPSGIALNPAQANQPVQLHKSGDLTLGGGLTKGQAYYLSPNPGKICPFADLAAGMDVVLIGVAKSTTVLAVDFAVLQITL